MRGVSMRVAIAAAWLCAAAAVRPYTVLHLTPQPRAFQDTNATDDADWNYCDVDVAELRGREAAASAAGGLVRIRVCEAMLGADGGAALARLCGARTEHLCVKRAGLCALGAAPVLEKCFGGEMAALRSLTMESDSLGDEALLAAVKAGRRLEGPALPELEDLALLNLEMSVEGVKALCSLLKKHAPKLKSLHLRGNRRLCDAGAVALARKYLAFPAARLNLRLVDVGDCGVGDCGAIAMADALRGKDEEALDLDLSNNLLTSVGVARLCRVAKILDARGADCDDAGRIAAALKASPALRALGLARCGLDPAAAAAIVGVLARRAPLLEALDLSGNALTPREHALKTKPAHKGVQVLFALRAAAKRFADDSGPLMQAETTCALVSLADELRGETAFAKLEWLGLANVGAERDHSKILKRAASKRPTLHVDLGANPAILRPQFAEPSL